VIRNLSRSRLSAGPGCCRASPLDRSEPIASLPASFCLANPRSLTDRRPALAGCMRLSSTVIARGAYGRRTRLAHSKQAPLVWYAFKAMNAPIAEMQAGACNEVAHGL
jgi:hypothetical protein